MTLTSRYDPSTYEDKWQSFWLKGGWLSPGEEADDVYTVLLPPPNVTSHLHMGHGLNGTLQDVLVRWHRMKGRSCCWLPGTDHAGISTQMMVEKSLLKEGIDPKALGREAFIQKCVEWKDKHGGIIIHQLQKLGASCDWSKEAYTMSPQLSKAVREIFVRLFEDGLIYRGQRLVHWDTHLQTALSDDEVEHKEVDGHLYHVRFLLENGEDHLVVATTRPETMLGDQAIAVHPQDSRYKAFHGQKVIHPLTKLSLPIILDEAVHPEFGSGCLKVTPAHDYVDFQIGQRHGLTMLDTFSSSGHLQNVPERFENLSLSQGKKAIVDELKASGHLIKEEPYKHSIPHSSRSQCPIEPRLSWQWYVKMASLAKPALLAAREGKVEFFPKNWQKTYEHWLENIEDWCISRQLWWGHQIPVWTCQACKNIFSLRENPSVCPQCQSADLVQDPDVLDTWFSSWLWPLSPFGWPDGEVDRFYPSQVLVTGPDIIFLWVARMIILGLYTKGEVPFRHVLFNATICDKKGRKFSKTLGNGFDPLDLIQEHGADAVRFTSVYLAPQGGRVKMEKQDFQLGSRFVTKLWNGARYVLAHQKNELQPLPDPSECPPPYLWLLSEFMETTKRMNAHLANYEINEAAHDLYQMIWGAFCDWGLESAKKDLMSEAHGEAALSVLSYVLEGILRLASPFIPFVCEEIWHHMLPHPQWPREKSLMISAYPQFSEVLYEEVRASWGKVQDIISSLRSLKTQFSYKREEAYVVADSRLKDLGGEWVFQLTGLKVLWECPPGGLPCFLATGEGYASYIPVESSQDLEKERARLKKEEIRLGNLVKKLELQLQDPSYLDRAPEAIIQQSQDSLQNLQNQRRSIEASLKALC